MTKIKSICDCYEELPKEATILDVGCLGFEQLRFGEKIKPGAFQYYGVDYCEAKDIPKNFNFKKADLNREPLPYEDDFFDLVVAKHIIEHLSNPIVFFEECVRVCKPNGFIYFEAPSERSLLLPGMPFQHQSFFSLSFFDDPTHQNRPWPPQAFYRLTRLFDCEPLSTGYLTSLKHRLFFPLTLLFALITRNGNLLERCVWNTIGWTSYLIAKKPKELKGKPSFNYYVPKR